MQPLVWRAQPLHPALVTCRRQRGLGGTRGKFPLLGNVTPFVIPGPVYSCASRMLTGPRTRQDFSAVDEWGCRDPWRWGPQVLREKAVKRRAVKLEERAVLSYHVKHTLSGDPKWVGRSRLQLQRCRRHGQSVIDHSQRRGHSFASKHVGLRGLSLQEVLADKTLALEKVHTATNPEDVCAQALLGDRICELCRLARVYVCRMLWAMTKRTGLCPSWMNCVDLRNSSRRATLSLKGRVEFTCLSFLVRLTSQSHPDMS